MPIELLMILLPYAAVGLLFVAWLLLPPDDGSAA